MNDSPSIAVLMRAGDIARADVLVTPERTYYRFVTEDSLDSGEIPAPADYAVLAETLCGDAEGKPSEDTLGSDILLKIQRNGKTLELNPTEQSLRRVIGLLMPMAPEFSFLGGFR